jgi:sulfite exporter TauE/SafE
LNRPSPRALLVDAPIWAMFVGWIAYFTRGLDLSNGLVNLGRVVIGFILGMAAASVVGSLGRPPAMIEMATIVFGVALVVLSLSFLPVFNNLLGFFLGLVAWFAHAVQKRLTAVAVNRSKALFG